MIKSTQIVIHNLTHQEVIQDRIPYYFRAFMDNYEEIFWAGMDITRIEVDEMLGIVRDEVDGHIMTLPEWPISSKKQLILQAYVRRHEKESSFKNSDGHPFLLVNKSLIFLKAGAGFGELALMSNLPRMASVKSATPCVLATLT